MDEVWTDSWQEAFSLLGERPEPTLYNFPEGMMITGGKCLRPEFAARLNMKDPAAKSK